MQRDESPVAAPAPRDVAAATLDAADVLARDAIGRWHLGDDLSGVQKCIELGGALPGKFGTLFRLFGQRQDEIEPNGFEDFAASLGLDGRHADQVTLLGELAERGGAISPAIVGKALNTIALTNTTLQLSAVAHSAERGEFATADAVVEELELLREHVKLNGPVAAFVSVKDVDAFPEVEPPTFAVEGLLYEKTFTIIGGDPKALKTTFTLDLALGFLAGVPVLDRFQVHKSGPVVVLQADMGESYFAYTMKQVAAGKSVNEFEHPFHYRCTTDIDLLKPETRSALKRQIIALRPALVVLDPMRDLFSGNENASDEVKPVLDFCLGLRDSTDACVVLVDHLSKPVRGTDPRKATGSPVGYLLRGAGSKYGRADSVLAIQDLGGVSGVAGTHRYGKALEPFCFRFEDRVHEGKGCQLVECEAPETGSNGVTRASPEERVLSWFLEHPGEHTVTQVKAGVGLGNYEKLKTALLTLLGRDKLSKRTEGQKHLWSVLP